MTYIPPRRSAGTIQQARTKLPWPKGRLFRILSIDGGGIKGVFPAAFLAEIEIRFLNGKSISNHFDMIAGTSTGGIIALGLANRLTAQDALQIYLQRGAVIFPSRKGIKGWLAGFRWWLNAKYDLQVLKDQLLEIFKDRLVDDATVRLVIPSFEGTHGEPYLYKTPHHPDYKKDRHEKAIHVALHTAAAPTFYAGVENDGYTMVDGGIWANNPIMNALVDVLSCYDVPVGNIRILSLGTGDELFSTVKHRTSGLLGWLSFLSGKAPLIFQAAVKAQSLNALGQAGLLIGRNNIIRIDPSEGNNPIGLDDVARACFELPAVARSHAEGTGHRVQDMFLMDKVDPFIKCSGV